MMKYTISTALLVSTLLTSTTALYILPSNTTYSLVQDYSGQAFFDNFNFFTGPDPTNGHVKFMNMSTANSTSTAGFLSGGPHDGAVYLAVDSTNITPEGRPSIRAESDQTYNHALFILDVGHAPGGTCGVWPAFWLLGTSSGWPAAGEIDIYEGVNNQTVNKMTLHTNAGVTIRNDTTGMKGSIATANCDVAAPNQDMNAGCQVVDPATEASFGTSFNNNLGGVFATEYTSKGIKIWFFPRGSIPADIQSGSPNPGNARWGVPNALFTNSNVNWDAHFCDLKLIVDTTFCGDWAGKVWPTSDCADLAPTCEEYVSNNPAAFKDAYWAIHSLKVYQKADDIYLRR